MRSEPKLLILLCSILLSGTLISFIFLPSSLYALLFGIIALSLSFFIKPEIILFFLLFARGGLDIIDASIYIGPMKLSAASGLSLFLVCVGIIYIVIHLTQKNLIFDKISKVLLCWSCFLIPWVLLAYSYFGKAGLIGIREWTRHLSFFVIYLLTLNLMVKLNYERVLNFLLLTPLIPILFGGYQLLYRAGMVREVHRTIGTFAYPGLFGNLLVLFIPLTFWMSIYRRQRRFFWGAIVLAETLMLVSTYTLTTFIIFIVVASLLFLAVRGNIQFKVVPAFLILILISVVFYSSPGRKRVERIKTSSSIMEALQTTRPRNTMEWRFLNWRILLKQFKKKPITGYGLNTSDSLVNPWRSSPHNDHIRFLVELGVIGFLGYLAFLYAVGREALLLYKRANRNEFKTLALVMIALYSGWLVGSFASNFITSIFLFYFWPFLAIASAIISKENENTVNM